MREAPSGVIAGVAAYLRAVRRVFGRVAAPGGQGAAESLEQANAKQPKEGFRPDVEGLRAVAVGVVLLYHAGVPFARGG